jgi:hypothetical protein
MDVWSRLIRGGLLLFCVVVWHGTITRHMGVRVPARLSELTMRAVRAMPPLEVVEYRMPSHGPIAPTDRPVARDLTPVRVAWNGISYIPAVVYAHPEYGLPRSVFGDTRFNPITDVLVYEPYPLPTMAYFSGTVRAVTTGTKTAFQAAIDAAVDTDIIELRVPVPLGNQDRFAPSAENNGVIWPNRGTNGHVLIRDQATMGGLPALETRVAESHFAAANEISVTGNKSCMEWDNGSAGWYFYGVLIRNQFSGSGDNSGLLKVSVPNPATLSNQVSKMAFVQTWFDGNWQTSAIGKWCRRALTFDVEYAHIRDSRITGFVGNGNESQTLNSSNAKGKIKIVNCALEACSETILWGGAVLQSTTQARNVDIFQSRLYCYRRADWMVSTAGFVHTNHKNFFEIKDGQYQVFERSYCTGHSGRAQQHDVNLKGTPQSAADSSTVAATGDVTVRLCFFTNSAAPVQLAGSTQVYRGTTRRVEIDRCLWTNTLLTATASRVLYSALNAGNGTVRDTYIHHCTFACYNTVITFSAGAPGACAGLRFVDNVNYATPQYSSPRGYTTGTAELDLICGVGAWTFAGNVTAIEAGQTANNMWASVPDNYAPTGGTAIAFVDAANGNYALAGQTVNRVPSGTTPITACSTTGGEPGVDMPHLTTMLVGVVAGSAAT